VFSPEVPRVASVSKRRCGTIWQGNRINKLPVGESAPEAGTIYLSIIQTRVVTCVVFVSRQMLGQTLSTATDSTSLLCFVPLRVPYRIPRFCLLHQTSWYLYQYLIVFSWQFFGLSSGSSSDLRHFVTSLRSEKVREFDGKV
jgi:hypothetical protein